VKRALTVESILNLIDKVISGEVGANEVLDQWSDIDQEQDSLLRQTWHELKHFELDEDIRAKDKEYGQGQIEDLKRLKDKIKRKYSIS
jgi:hypothetical protein